MRRMRDAEGQAILVIDGSLPPVASGPPPHVHFHQREEVNVKAGTLGARVGKETIRVPAGGTGVFPAGVVHAWWNAGDDLLELSGRAVPAGDLDRYLQALFAVLNASPGGRPSIFYIAHVSWRHRHTQAGVVPPRIIQRIFSHSFCLSATPWENTAGPAGPVRPNRAQGHRKFRLYATA